MLVDDDDRMLQNGKINEPLIDAGVYELFGKTSTFNVGVPVVLTGNGYDRSALGRDFHRKYRRGN